MPDYIRANATLAPGMFREIEPISPYPRIDPHQPRRDDDPGQRSGSQQPQNDRARRRFMSMRELVEKLQETCQISRVDYSTAETEMHSQGLEIAEEELIGQLLQLKIPLTEIEDLFQQIRLQNSMIGLESGRILTSESFPLFPRSAEGLTEYSLNFPDLRVRVDRSETRIIEAINDHGRFTSDVDRLRLSFRRQLPGSDLTAEGQLALDIQVLVGASELDEAGRRAILYPRSATHFGLYADKLINLSI